MSDDIDIGNIDYTTIDVDKNVSYDSLKDRVVIITGGGQGIGRGYAHYFAAQGAIPVIAEMRMTSRDRRTRLRNSSRRTEKVSGRRPLSKRLRHTRAECTPRTPRGCVDQTTHDHRLSRTADMTRRGAPR